MKYTLRYKIVIPWFQEIDNLMDMFRYSGDWIEEVVSKNVYILRHFLQHRERSTKFYHSQTKKRWESFGVVVEVLGEVEATEFDKTYRYEKGEIPIIEGLTKTI